MRSPPKFLEGAYVSALRVAMEEIQRSRQVNDETARSRGWKLFLLILRMLFHRAPRGGLIPKNTDCVKGSRSSQTAGGSHSFRQAGKFAKLRVCRSVEDREQDPTRLSVRMLDFGQFDFGQFDFGQQAEIEIGRSRNWPKSKLAEVETGRNRNWPKSKLAEVEIGRSRN